MRKLLPFCLTPLKPVFHRLFEHHSCQLSQRQYQYRFHLKSNYFEKWSQKLDKKLKAEKQPVWKWIYDCLGEGGIGETLASERNELDLISFLMDQTSELLDKYFIKNCNLEFRSGYNLTIYLRPLDTCGKR